jgi:hypothetical protein
MEFKKFITLTQDEFANVPGKSATKEPSYYRGQIIALLEQIGAEGYGVFDGNIVFMKKFEVADGVVRNIRFTIRPVLIQVKTQRKGKAKELVPKPSTSWYLLWQLLEKKIAAIKIGITDITEEFMPNIVMIDHNGIETTMGDTVKAIIDSDKLNNILQLEDLR